MIRALTNRRRIPRDSSTKMNNHNSTRQRARPSRLLIEKLEDRTLLSIDYRPLPNLLQSVVNTVETNVAQQFAHASNLPLIGNQLDLRGNQVLSGPLGTIAGKLGQASDTDNALGDLQGALGSLGTVEPATAYINNDTGVTAEILVHQDFGLPMNLPKIELNVLGTFVQITPQDTTLQGISVSVGFDFLLQFTYTGNTNVVLGLAGANGLAPLSSIQGAPSVNAPLAVNVSAGSVSRTAPFQFTAVLNNLLSTTITDQGDSYFQAAVGVPLDPGGNAGGLFLAPGSQALLDLALDAQLLPGQQTLNVDVSSQLMLGWQFNNSSVDNLDSSSSFSQVQFKSVQLQPKFLIGNFIGPIVQDVQHFTQPLEPIVSILNAAIPGLSLFGLNLTLAQVLDKFSNSGTTIEDIANAIDRINHLDTNPNVADPTPISFGDFSLASPSGRALTPQDLGGPNPNFQIAPKAFSRSGSVDALNFINGLENTIPGLTFPLLDIDQQGHAPGVINLLLGRDVPLFQYNSGNTFQATVNFPDVPLFSIGFVTISMEGSFNFGAVLDVGYDTAGVRQYLQDHNGADLAHGFYVVQSDTGLHIGATIGLKGSVVIATVHAGVSGGIDFNLKTSYPAVDGKIRLDDPTLLENLSDPFALFDVSGEVKLVFSIDVGFDVGPFHVTLFSFSLPDIPLFDLSTIRSPADMDASDTISIQEAGDHDIHIHGYTQHSGPNYIYTGIEIDDQGNQLQPVQRFPTTQFHFDGQTWQPGLLHTYKQIDILFIGFHGTHRVIIDPDVYGDNVTDPAVNVQVLDFDRAPGGSDNDDFENHSRGDAVFVGGIGNSTLIGGSWEFGGGLPYGMDLQAAGLPTWANIPQGDTYLLPILPNEGDDLLIGSGHLFGGSGHNSIYGSGYLYGGGSALELANVQPGDPNYFIAGRNDFYVGHPYGMTDELTETLTGTDMVYGGNGGPNYLQFFGNGLNLSADGRNDAIEVVPNPFLRDSFDAQVGIVLSDTYLGLNEPTYSLSATDIDELSIEIEGGTVRLGHDPNLQGLPTLSDTRLQSIQVWDLKPNAGVDVTVFAQPIVADDDYDISTDGHDGMFLKNEHYDPIVHGFLQDSPPIDLQGLTASPVSKSSVTLIQGNQLVEPVRINERNLDTGNGVTLTVQSGLALSLTLEDSTLPNGALWDIAGTNTTLTYYVYDPKSHKNLKVTQAVNYSNVATLAINGGINDNTFRLSPIAENVDELPETITLSANGGTSEIDVFDQKSTYGESWSVGPLGVTRTSDFIHGAPFVLRTISYVPPADGKSPLAALVIDGGVGSSTFALTNYNGTSGGDLDDLPISVTLNGAGNPKDTLIADDSQNNARNTIWSVSGTKIRRTFPVTQIVPGSHTGDTTIDYSKVANLVLRGGAVAKKYLLSPEQRNLDELPAHVTIQDQDGNFTDNQLVINDQDSQPEYWPELPQVTSWLVNGTTIQRTNYVKAFLLGVHADFPSLHTITHDAETVTINGGQAGNHFVAHVWLLGSLTILGGTSADLLTIDDRDGSGSSQWDLSATRVLRALPGTIPFVFPINYFGLGSLEVDGANAGASFTLQDPGTPLTTIDMGPAPDVVLVNGLSGLLTVKGAASGTSTSLNRITINNAPIDLTPTSAAYISDHFAVNSSFVFLDNQSTESRIGLFADSQGHVLMAGSVFLSQGMRLELVSYNGDDDNKDVVLDHLNAPPTISALSFEPIEAVSSALTANINDPDLTDTLAVTVDWGDHSQPGVYHLPGGFTAFRATHSYPEETTVPYHVQVTVTDGHAGDMVSAMLQVTVGDAPLQLLSVGNGTAAVNDHPELFPAEKRAFQGIVAQFSDPGNDGTAQDYTTTITWGDGSAPTKGTVTVVMLFDGLRRIVVQGSHLYAEEGKFPLHVDLTDVGGSKLSAGGTELVLDAPLQGQGRDGQVAVDQKFNGAVAVFTDPGSDGTANDYLATIDWGDPTDFTSLGSIQANGAGQFVVYGEYRYRARGRYTVTVEIDDVGGSIVTVTGTIDVGEAPSPGNGPGGGASIPSKSSDPGRSLESLPMQDWQRAAIDVIMGDHSTDDLHRSGTNNAFLALLLRSSKVQEQFPDWCDLMGNSQIPR